MLKSANQPSSTHAHTQCALQVPREVSKTATRAAEEKNSRKSRHVVNTRRGIELNPVVVAVVFTSRFFFFTRTCGIACVLDCTNCQCMICIYRQTDLLLSVLQVKTEKNLVLCF